MDKTNHIISDDELIDLSESAPLTEGGLLEDLLGEARRVASAVKETGVDVLGLDRNARALLYMRCFYFLGVLRGGEAYRASLLDDSPGASEPLQVPFSLSEGCTDMFVKEIQGEPSETLESIYEVVQLTKRGIES